MFNRLCHEKNLIFSIVFHCMQSKRKPLHHRLPNFLDETQNLHLFWGRMSCPTVTKPVKITCFHNKSHVKDLYPGFLLAFKGQKFKYATKRY